MREWVFWVKMTFQLNEKEIQGGRKSRWGMSFEGWWGGRGGKLGERRINCWRLLRNFSSQFTGFRRTNCHLTALEDKRRRAHPSSSSYSQHQVFDGGKRISLNVCIEYGGGVFFGELAYLKHSSQHTINPCILTYKAGRVH